MAETPQITSFIADPPIVNPGQSVTLIWTTTGATSASINNGVGTVPSSGSTTVSPSATTVYTLTASNGSATATASVTVTVAPSTVLVYAVTPTSVPCSAPGNTSTVTLEIIATNQNSSLAEITEILFTFPVGTEASDLVADAAGISVATTGTDWSISANGGVFTVLANSGVTGVGGNDAIGFIFSDIVVNDAVGTAAIAVTEFSATPQAQTALQITKIPPATISS